MKDGTNILKTVKDFLKVPTKKKEEPKPISIPNTVN
jgi:hypothetical protein